MSRYAALEDTNRRLEEVRQTLALERDQLGDRLRTKTGLCDDLVSANSFHKY